MENKKKFGQLYTDHIIKSHEETSVIDQQREMQKEFMIEVWRMVEHNYFKGTCANAQQCVCPAIVKEDGKLVDYGPFGLYRHTFFIEIITKQERIFEKAIRNYFLARKTCPTPQYDQSVFIFDVKSEKLLYLWTLPDKETHSFMSSNRMQIPKEQYQLLGFVLSDLDGSLLRMAKHLNGEEDNSIFLKGN